MHALANTHVIGQCTINPRQVMVVCTRGNKVRPSSHLASGKLVLGVEHLQGVSKMTGVSQQVRSVSQSVTSHQSVSHLPITDRTPSPSPHLHRALPQEARQPLSQPSATSHPINSQSTLSATGTAPPLTPPPHLHRPLPQEARQPLREVLALGGVGVAQVGEELGREAGDAGKLRARAGRAVERVADGERPRVVLRDGGGGGGVESPMAKGWEGARENCVTARGKLGSRSGCYPSAKRPFGDLGPRAPPLAHIPPPLDQCLPPLIRHQTASLPPRAPGR